MKPIPKWFGNVSGGKMELYDREGFLKYVSNLVGEIELIVRKKQKNRTLNQNTFYRIYLELIADEYGDDPNDLHEYFKSELLPTRFAQVMGKRVEIPPSTTGLNTKEFSDYMEKICKLTGVPIPDSKKVYV